MFMPIGNAVVFQSGNKPIIAPRYDTFSDTLYKELIECEDSKEKQMTA